MKCLLCEKWIKPNEEMRPFKYFWGFYHTKCMNGKLKKDYPSLYEILWKNKNGLKNKD